MPSKRSKLNFENKNKEIDKCLCNEFFHWQQLDLQSVLCEAKKGWLVLRLSVLSKKGWLVLRLSVLSKVRKPILRWKLISVSRATWLLVRIGICYLPTQINIRWRESDTLPKLSGDELVEARLSTIPVSPAEAWSVTKMLDVEMTRSRPGLQLLSSARLGQEKTENHQLQGFYLVFVVHWWSYYLLWQDKCYPVSFPIDPEYNKKLAIKLNVW